MRGPSRPPGRRPHPAIIDFDALVLVLCISTLRALKYIGCEASEAVHIGDSLGSDIQGGINAGLAATVWVNPSGTPAPDGKPQPTRVVSPAKAPASALGAAAADEGFRLQVKLVTELPDVIEEIEQQ